MDDRRGLHNSPRRFSFCQSLTYLALLVRVAFGNLSSVKPMRCLAFVHVPTCNGRWQLDQLWQTVMDGMELDIFCRINSARG